MNTTPYAIITIEGACGDTRTINLYSEAEYNDVTLTLAGLGIPVISDTLKG
jgi:hypothetical protein